jgi:hypothetical protein
MSFLPESNTWIRPLQDMDRPDMSQAKQHCVTKPSLERTGRFPVYPTQRASARHFVIWGMRLQTGRWRPLVFAMAHYGFGLRVCSFPERDGRRLNGLSDLEVPRNAARQSIDNGINKDERGRIVGQHR